MNGPNHMHITWITKESGNPSTVEYGTTSGAYGANASGTSSSYTYILYKSGEIHDVVIGPLKDDTVYYYRCGGSTTEYSFKTPPPAGPNVPITFVVTGAFPFPPSRHNQLYALLNNCSFTLSLST